MTLRHMAMLAVLFGCVSGTAIAAPAADVFYRQRVAEALAIAADEPGSRADALLDRLLADPDYAGLPPAERNRLLSRAALVAWQNDRLDVASQRYAELARLDSDNPDDWYRMAGVAMQKDDMDGAAEAMTEFAARWPEYLDNTRPELLFMLATHGDTRSPARIGFQQALFDANWKGGSSNTPGAIWFRLARARLEQGNVEAARAVVQRIQEPEFLISMRADKRFDPVFNRDRPRFDVALAVDRQIALLRTRTQVFPDRLEPLLHLSSTLLLAGRNEDAIALSDAAVARIAAASTDKPAFSDMDQQVWLMNNKAIALRRMGRTEEAIAEMRRASQLSENGEENISQVLNLGEFECANGNAAEAIRIVAAAPLANLSNYGKAVAAHVRHCAALQQDDSRQQKKALKELHALRDDAPMPYLDALIQVEPEQALAFMRQLLARPDRRNDVLDWAQDCLQSPLLPGEQVPQQRQDAFLARADVRAAIDGVGRIERYPLYCRQSR